MSIALGWRPKDTRHSYWRGDPDVEVTDAVAYERTGDRAYCRVKPGGSADLLTFRALTHHEQLFVNTHEIHGGNDHDRLMWRMALTFRIAVRFPDKTFIDAAGNAITEVLVTEHGYEMLNKEILLGLIDGPGFGWDGIMFYAGLIALASQAGQPDFSQSSPRSIAPKSRTRTARKSSVNHESAAPSSSDASGIVPT